LKWVIDFDRANANCPEHRMFFCKDCGQPFERLNDIGTHTREFHNPTTKIVERAQAEAEAETEEKLLAGEKITDEPIKVERRGAKKGRTFTCHDCGVTLPNLYATRVHKKLCHGQAPIEVPTAEMTQQAYSEEPWLNYSQASIANLALNRIGARGDITDVNENSPNAKKVLSVWDAVFQEVLSERDWKFAKTRIALQLSPNPPLYAYKYAWALPSDFLRFVRPHKRPPDRNLYAWLWGPEGYGWYNRADPPFWPVGFPYVVEIQPCPGDPTNILDNNKYCLTDYGGIYGPAKINYIRLITDMTLLMPGFVNCLAYRLAAELAIGITEDKQKFQGMEQMYRESLNSAEAQNETSDYQRDETGSESWEQAGRWVRWY
jgi:hypothetical protein